MPRDADATRRRILEAATEEFSAHGLAGARVDRIAKSSGANPRSIYAYFESKEGLFSAVIDHVIRATVERVPITVDDLPGFAGRVFDDFVAHPQTLRIALWRQLERPDFGPDLKDVFAEKIAALDTGRPGAIPVTDLVVLLYGIAQAWLLSPRDLLAADGRAPYTRERLLEHRAIIVDAARRLTDPRPAG
jgi:AcrR family transcriptional regulator